GEARRKAPRASVAGAAAAAEQRRRLSAARAPPPALAAPRRAIAQKSQPQGHTVRWTDRASGYDLCRGCVEHWRERAPDEGAQAPRPGLPGCAPSRGAGAPEDEPTAAQGGDAAAGDPPPADEGGPPPGGGGAPAPEVGAEPGGSAAAVPAGQLLADASQRSLASEAGAAPKDALEDIPEPQLHAEVQALVVSANLESTTVGQLRAALEKRLGLQVGSLGSRKSLRRRVCQLFQQEVLKKAQRGADCERIAKALVDYDDYPADVRQMLIESLPHAMRARPLHAHQVRLLGIANDALGDYRGQLSGLLTSSEAQCELAEAEERGRQAARHGAASAEAQAEATAGAAKALLEDAVAEVTRTEHQLEQAEQMMQVAAEEVAELQRAREAIVRVSDGPFRLLMRGEWAGKEDLERAFAAVQQHFENYNAEEALLAAAGIALRQRPSERTRFDEITLSSLEETLSGHLGSCEARLAEKPEFQAESKRLAASALLGVVVQRQQEQFAASKAAHDAHAEASAARRAAEVELAAASAAVAAARCEQARLKEGLDALDQTLALLARIIAGEAPPAADAEAGAAASAAAEALAEDIICEASSQPEVAAALEGLGAPALALGTGASLAGAEEGAAGASQREGGSVEVHEVADGGGECAAAESASDVEMITEGDEGAAVEVASDVEMARDGDEEAAAAEAPCDAEVAPVPAGEGASAGAEEDAPPPGEAALKDPMAAAALLQEGGDGRESGCPEEAAEDGEDGEDEEEDDDEEGEEGEEGDAPRPEDQAPPADAAPGSAGSARPRDTAGPARGEATRASDAGSPACSPRRPPSAKTGSDRTPLQRVPTPLSPGGFPVPGQAA
ncbi:unnamed protein product, partial [Prorocentrum cordatum]